MHRSNSNMILIIDMAKMAASEVGYAGWWCRSAGHGGNATEKSDN